MQRELTEVERWAFDDSCTILDYSAFGNCWTTFRFESFNKIK